MAPHLEDEASSSRKWNKGGIPNELQTLEDWAWRQRQSLTKNTCRHQYISPCSLRCNLQNNYCAKTFNRIIITCFLCMGIVTTTKDNFTTQQWNSSAPIKWTSIKSLKTKKVGKKCKKTPIYFMISNRVSMMKNWMWIIIPYVETQRHWK